MARPSGNWKRHPVTIALSATAGAVLLLVLAVGYGTQFRIAGNEPARITTPAFRDGTTEALAISVFDQPRPLPAIAFADGENRALSLADFRGRVVLLNLWATWCVPCRKEMPSLDHVQARLGGDDFIVIPLSLDRAGVPAVEKFYREVGVEKLGIYIDPSSQVSYELGAPGVPTTLLIGRDGREVARKMGEADWNAPDMVALIRRVMATNSGDARAAR